MKNFLHIQITFFSFLILFASTSFAQTFWGTTPSDGSYGGGTLFSFDAKTDTYTDEYFFRGSAVYEAIHVFEESPNVFIGVCGASYADVTEAGNSIYRYDATSNTTEIIFNYPYNTYHSGDIGEMAYIGNNSIIGLSDIEDTIRITRYDISTDTYQEFGSFSSENYPDNGDYSYHTNACYFSEISESMVIFSLPKVLGGANSSTTLAGRDFFGYNPQTNEIGLLFNIPSSQPYYPRGPFTKTTDGHIFAPMTGSILEINLTDSTYQAEYTFNSGYVMDGELVQATDTTLVGLKNIGESGYLFEYDFKNNVIDTALYLGQKAQFNAFVQRGDSLYFGGDNNKIFAYKIGSEEAPVVSYTLQNPNQGYLNYLVNSSDESYILSFAAGLHQYFPDKKAYTTFVRFGGNGNFWDFAEGATPTSELLLASNGKLYGYTVNGGTGTFSHGDGVLFEVDPETKDFQLLHSFVGENGGFGDRDSYGTYYGKGQNSLTEVNQKIYGTTYTNGAYDNHPAPGYGVVYSYNISRDYDNYRVVHNFNDSIDASAGRFPMSGLTLGSNGKLYGITALGGIGGIYGHGVVYEIDPNNNDEFRVVVKIPDTDLRPLDNLVLAENGKLYGLASGAEFNSSPKQWAIREYDIENASYKDLYTSELADYEYNYSQFTLLNNKLYGVVFQSYTNYGYIFEFDITTQQLVKKIIFPSNNTVDGAKPKGNLTLSSTGSFWGMTSSGGVHSDDWGDYNWGVIYEFNPVEETYTKHYDFGNSGGRNPMYASLTETAGVDYTSISSSILEESVNAYPNPTIDYVRFEFNNQKIQDVQYSIFNSSGKLIDRQTILVSNYLIIDFSAYKQGAYLVKLEAAKQRFSKTIIRK